MKFCVHLEGRYIAQSAHPLMRPPLAPAKVFCLVGQLQQQNDNKNKTILGLLPSHDDTWEREEKFTNVA